MINIMCGISGSGKSTFINKHRKNDDENICPDVIRELLTGSVSDQSKNREVWDAAYRWLEGWFEEGGGTLWFDATSLSKTSLVEICKRASKADHNVTIYVARDSFDKELCKARIANDIANKVNRSNVPPDISDKQHERFISLVNGDTFDELKKEYSDISIEVKYF